LSGNRVLTAPAEGRRCRRSFGDGHEAGKTERRVDLEIVREVLHEEDERVREDQVEEPGPREQDAEDREHEREDRR
jgi:hypothetical protein